MIILFNTIKDFVNYVIINKLKMNFRFFFIGHFINKIDSFSNSLIYIYIYIYLVALFTVSDFLQCVSPKIIVKYILALNKHIA